MTKETQKVSKVIKIILLSVFYLIVAFLLLFSIATLSRKRADDIPNIFGFGFLAVNENADSMVGDNEDSFNPNDLVFVKVLSDSEKEKLNLKQLKEESIVVSFYDYNIKAINTHRVVEYDALTETIRTQGDNEDEADSFTLSKTDIIGIYHSKMNSGGKVITFMQSKLGFALVVVLPMLLLFIYQGYQVLKNVFVVKEEKLKEKLELETEEKREKMRKELLEEIKREQVEREE
ncbi:MAG: hypothetical protein RBQ97_00590 [Acholeplasma sp.]|nr:hypothetical protein [Acholeplasma sp.]